MHPLVIEFRDRLLGYTEGDGFPAPALREEVLILHHNIHDEESRLELMRLFNVIADIVEAHLVRDRQDTGAFRLHRQGQIWEFLRAESLIDGEIDRRRLLRVTRREIAAVRLDESDEIHRYALGDDHAFDALLSLH